MNTYQTVSLAFPLTCTSAVSTNAHVLQRLPPHYFTVFPSSHLSLTTPSTLLHAGGLLKTPRKLPLVKVASTRTSQ